MIEKSDLYVGAEKEINRLLKIEEERHERYINRYPDEKDADITRQVHHFYKKFIWLSYLMSRNEAKMYSELYIKHIAGVEWGEEDMWNKIGKALNSVAAKAPRDHISFWTDVGKLLPQTFTKEEISWMAENDVEAFGAHNLIFLLGMEGRHPAVDILNINHIWK